MVVLMTMTANAAILHTFDTFTVRNSEDQSCFTITKTTEDSTKANLNKCIVGCGGSLKIKKAPKSQQYSFQLYSDEKCSGTPSTDALFVCPNPSIKPIDVKGTSNNIKCGTLPPRDLIDSEANENDDDASTVAVDSTETDTKTKGSELSKPKSSPSSSSSLSSSSSSSGKPEGSSESAASDDSSSKSKTKSGGNGETAENDHNSAISKSVISVSLIIVSLLAVLSL